jgi:hypothetical protein
MRLRLICLTGVLAVTSVAGACGEASSKITGPTSTTSTEARDFSGPRRDTPPPTQPSNPPPVDRDPLPPRPPSPPTSGSCDGSKAEWAIGERASNELLERARIAAGAGSARFVRPNEPVTTEYLGSRLNLGLDTQEIVRSVVCG